MVRFDDETMQHTSERGVPPSGEIKDCCSEAKNIWASVIESYCMNADNPKARTLPPKLSVDEMSCDRFKKMLLEINQARQLTVLSNIANKYLLSKLPLMNMVTTNLLESLVPNAIKSAGARALESWQKCEREAMRGDVQYQQWQQQLSRDKQ
jgi:hypothetical protein